MLCGQRTSMSLTPSKSNWVSMSVSSARRDPGWLFLSTRAYLVSSDVNWKPLWRSDGDRSQRNSARTATRNWMVRACIGFSRDNWSAAAGRDPTTARVGGLALQGRRCGVAHLWPLSPWAPSAKKVTNAKSEKSRRLAFRGGCCSSELDDALARRMRGTCDAGAVSRGSEPTAAFQQH